MNLLTKLKSFGAMLALWLVLSGCGESSESPAVEHNGLTKVVLQTDWYAQPEHAGFYTAWQQGMYSDAGIDVEIRPGANMTNVPQMVATGRIEFAVGTTDNLFMAISRGAPLIALFPYFQHDPQCVMVHANSGVETLNDLDGRVVMINPGAAYVQYLREALDIQPQLVPLDYSLARFLGDPEFAQQCFVTSEPYYVAQQGVEARILPLSGSGFDPYRIVYTNRDFYAANRELVEAFTRASLGGWRAYMASDGVEVHQLLMTRNPQQTEAFTAWTKNAIHEYELITGSAEEGEYLGKFDRDRVAVHLQQLQDINLLDAPLDIAQIVAWDLQAVVADVAAEALP